MFLTIPKFGVLVSLQERVTVDPVWASWAVLLGVRKVTSLIPNILESISVSSDLALRDEDDMLLPTATTEMHHPSVLSALVSSNIYQHFAQGFFH